MHILKNIFLLTSLFLTACGGGSSKSSNTTSPPPVNATPVINSVSSIIDESNNTVIERGDGLTILLTITDSDGDAISGIAKLNSDEAVLEVYTGELNYTHKANFIAPEAGVYTVSVKASDSKGASSTANIDLSVNPNKEDVVSHLENNVSGFIAGGSYEGAELLGISTDDNDVNIGYIDTPLNDRQSSQNEFPYGECGASTPHKFLEVQKDTTGVIVPSFGIVYPLECFTTTQAKSIQKKLSKAKAASNSFSSISNLEYIAQNITVTFETTEDGTSVTTTSTGSGFTLEGNMFDVVCGDYALSKTNSNYLIDSNKIVNDIEILIDDSDKFTLECHRTVEFEGEIYNSNLIGIISGGKVTIDSFDPTGSINGIIFSAPYSNGGLDVGNVCVATTVEDNSGYVTESLELTSSDGLVENIAFGDKNDSNKYCMDLLNVEGSYHVTQIIMDGSENTVTNQSQSFQIGKNQAPVFSAEVPNSILLNTNQGFITLIEQSDVSDPEGHSISLTGDISIDTEQDAGEYSLTAYATDEFNAQTEKSMVVTLVDNIPPTALPVADAGQGQSINTGTTVQLDGSGSFDDDGDQISFKWTLDSKPFISFASLNGATTATPSIKVDKAGEYLISLVVNDGNKDSEPSSITLIVVEGVNPISENIDLIIVAGHKYHGFSGSNYEEVLQSQTTACWNVGAIDIDDEGTLYSVSTFQSQAIQAVDPSQPLCIEQGPQPRNMHGLAIDSDGTFWGTSDLITTGNQRTKLYHLEKDGTVLNELDFSGDEDVIYGVDFASDGTLYGVGFTSRKLVTIDTGTGVTTLVTTIEAQINVHDIDVDSNNILRILDDNLGDLYEFDLNGVQLRQTNIPSICTSCGWVSIATNN